MEWLMAPLSGFNGLDTTLEMSCTDFCDCNAGLMSCTCQGGLVVVKPPKK